MDNFNVINEKNEFKLGTILAIFTLPNYSKEFALFSVSDYDGDHNDLHVSYIDKNSDGYDYLTEITDPKVLTDATSVIKDIIVKLNNKSTS